MKVQPYLFFDGRCEEAIEFYKRALGAKDVNIMRFKDAPPGEQGGRHLSILKSRGMAHSAANRAFDLTDRGAIPRVNL